MLTATPASRRRSSPRPATFASGSTTAMTTRATPASINALVHGGVLPSWSHGSSVVYAVAPRARSPAAASAATSACGPTGKAPVAPRPTITPSRAITHPTEGHGGRAAGVATAASMAAAIRTSSSVSVVIVVTGSPDLGRPRGMTTGRACARTDDGPLPSGLPRPGAPRGYDARPRLRADGRRPSPIRTLTVGRGISPHRLVTGGHEFADFHGRAVVTAGRDLHPYPEGNASVVRVTVHDSER